VLARIQISLPNEIIVVDEEDYPSVEKQYGEYVARFLALERSEELKGKTNQLEALIDGRKGISTDVLCIEFKKDEFNRKKGGSVDPPEELIDLAVNNFLSGLRYVSNAFQIKHLDFGGIGGTDWVVRYRNDDGTELEKEEGFVRGRFRKGFKLSWVIMTSEMWNDAHGIENPSELPAWNKLLLDAQSMLPECGPAIIFAFTALEVFISTMLDTIAEGGAVDKNLWGWINERGFSGYFKEPSITEKFDILASCLIGRSLKEDNDLWESFVNLKKARNSFAHSGIAELNGNEVDQTKAIELINEARKIIQFFRDALPDKFLWPTYKYEFKSEISGPAIKVSDLIPPKK